MLPYDSIVGSGPALLLPLDEVVDYKDRRFYFVQECKGGEPINLIPREQDSQGDRSRQTGA